MSKEKSPAFQFYPKDFMTDDKVLAMSAEVKGYYITLLCIDWLNDGFYANALLKLCGFEWHKEDFTLRSDSEEIEEQLLECFVSHPSTDKSGFVTNPRLLKERQKQIERSTQAQEAANKRWDDSGNAKPKRAHKQKDADAMPTQCTSSSSSSSSSNNNINTQDSNLVRAGEFKLLCFDQITWEAMLMQHQKAVLDRAIQLAESYIEKHKTKDPQRYQELKKEAESGKAYLNSWAISEAYKQLSNEKAAKIRLDRSKEGYKKPEEASRPQPQQVGKITAPPPLSVEQIANNKKLIEQLKNKTLGRVSA